MSENELGGNVAAAQTGRLVLLRHGQTVWSESGQHTGRTNIPLTSVVEQQALAAGERLRAAFPEGFGEGCVFASPLKRAQQTARLAGFDQVATLDDIAEWDYGRAEGRTRQTVSDMAGFDWDVWRDGPTSLPEFMNADWQETLPGGERVQVHAGAGESLNDAAARACDVIGKVGPFVESGKEVLLVAHAHILRILTSQWIGLDPGFGRLLRLDTAHYSVLSLYKGDRVIERWNC